MDKIPQSIIEKAKKLYALSKRGVGGEKDNAEEFLNKLLEKYAISMDQMCDDHMDFRIVNLRPYEYYHRELVKHCALKVLGERGRSYKYNAYYKGKRNRKRHNSDTMYWFECTMAEHVELLETIDFYYHHFMKDLDKFWIAFWNKNELYSPEAKAKNSEEMTPEQLREMMEIAEMMGRLQQRKMPKAKVDNKKFLE